MKNVGKIHKVLLTLLAISSIFTFAKYSRVEAPNLLITKEGGVNLLANVLTQPYTEPVIEMVLLGKAELSYAGSTKGRAKNIELGVERINGTIIQKDEEFSYIKALGPVSSSDGFSEEKAFRDGEVTLGLGGGLCQVSTILFQTALNAGLPITERQNHTYSVVFYQIGLDATFANPAPDLKFLNNTSGTIIIKGKTENQVATFEIYGIPDGRVATISKAKVYNKTPLPPTKYVYNPIIPTGTEKCERYSQIGYTAKVVYDILYADGTNNQQIFYSTYKPLSRVCQTSAPQYAPPILDINNTPQLFIAN